MPLLPIKEAFTAPAIGVYFNTYQQSLGLPPYLGTGFFPNTKVGTLDLKFFKGSKGLPISLTPSNYDALATLRDRIGFKEFENEMPFFRESYLVKEKDIQEYENVMNAVDSTAAMQILKNIMLGPADLIMGANVVPERMRWQLLAPIDGSPKIALSANGINIDVNYDPDGSYKAKHFMQLVSATDKWTDFENADPYEDLRAAQKAQKKNTGIAPTVALMNDNTFQLIVKNKKIHNYLLAQNPTANILVDDGVVKTFIQRQLGITIQVYDALYKKEDGEATTFIPDNMVTLVPGLVPLGNTCYGKTPEERTGSESTGTLQIVNTGVAVYTYTTPHPINTHCVVSEIVLPSYERMDDTYVLKVA